MAELVYGARFRFTWSKLPCLERGVGSNPTLVKRLSFCILFCRLSLEIYLLGAFLVVLALAPAQVTAVSGFVASVAIEHAQVGGSFTHIRL